MPTALILVFTIVIMVTVIPYAFSSVLKQMDAVRAMEAAGATEFILQYAPLKSISAEISKSIKEEEDYYSDANNIKNTTEL